MKNVLQNGYWLLLIGPGVLGLCYPIPVLYPSGFQSPIHTFPPLTLHFRHSNLFPLLPIPIPHPLIPFLFFPDLLHMHVIRLFRAHPAVIIDP